MRNKSKAAGGRLAVVLAVVAGLTAVAGQAAADEMKPIRIGVLTDLGGVTADATGKGSVEAARLAVEDMGGKVAGRPVGHDDVDLAGYSRTAYTELETMFPRLPNPTLVMYVFPHLAGVERVPVPGYATTFPLYERVEYALPGEVPSGQR